MTSQPSNSTSLQEVMRQAEAALPEDVVTLIHSVQEGPEPKSQLIAVLHRLQASMGYLGEKQLDAVAQLLRVPMADVAGVATFYHFFQLNKPGKYVISVCTGTACYVRGADKVIDKLREELGIDLGETTTDGRFSLQQARCLGMCGLAPVLMVNDEVYEKVTPDRIPALLEQYSRSESPE